ncbi:mannose-1-phosphate guanylyltransferase/mannose-6-phosphate isomerase [Helicobacter sp. T3_23-1059]
MTNLILCGGSGTRLYPLSRGNFPKQFLPLFEKQSLYELTLKRNAKICQHTIIAVNNEQYFLAQNLYENLCEGEKITPNAHFLVESKSCNTAPAITLSILSLLETSISQDQIVLITPSDHLIRDENAYKQAIQKAKDYAQQDFLVCFGITPKAIETGFGYIHAGANDEVKGFYEKPSYKQAKEFIESGEFFFNAGIFCFKISAFLEQMKIHAPKILQECQKALNHTLQSNTNQIRGGGANNKNKQGDENAQSRTIKIADMSAIPTDSIDYALMEKCKALKCVSVDMGWSDLGSFDSLYDELAKTNADENANVAPQDSILLQSKANLFVSSSQNKRVCAVGVENLIAIDSPDTLLLCKRGESQQVKQIAQITQKMQNNDECYHTITRPWGNYTVLEVANGYKLKRIEVKPNKRLSLQKHYHRSEHWIVLSGSATVTIEGKTQLVRANESAYIQMGQVHRLANEGKIPLVIVEIQVGQYTGEDDIVRIEDDFARG